MAERRARTNFTPGELRRLHYARFLVKSGLLSDWAGSGEDSACFECRGALRPIRYGQPAARPDGAVFGGLVGYPDDPEYACLPCRRYFGNGGEPYHGPRDPLDVW